MKTHITQDKLFCNGAEEFIGDEYRWIFITNYSLLNWRHVLACVRLSGYNVVIDKDTTDRFGCKLTDSFAIYEPEILQADPVQKAARSKFFELDTELRDAYKQKLISRGVVPADYFSWRRPCYVGCEKEYGLTLPDDF